MKIILSSVKPEDMRLEAYRSEGCGDWFFDPRNGDLHIVVAGPDVFDDDDTFLLALHEMYEAKACFNAGITQGRVDAFDKAFEGETEPGDAEDSPYRRQHRAACILEHMAAILLGKWDHGEVS